ncbi:MAG: hypothetical protein DMG20_04840 [Acidobacteria bacterium]|nr:MAG: hypothetical protein DMG20_04840 [Acidobacteriota bacterium]
MKAAHRGKPNGEVFHSRRFCDGQRRRYFHMSNAELTLPNHGFNGSMLSIGMRWNRIR